ncbi:MAG: S8 family serine peptidase, partial [Oscillospiraceae bacterium]|nr:S8 family serine peptidase [Oscillospiraceae bacterium]
MKGNLKRILSAFLALTLVLSCMPTVFAAEAAGTAGDALGGPLSLTAPSGNADREISFAPQGEEKSEADEEPSPEPTEAPAAAVTEGLPKFEPSEQERFSESEAAKAYGADDIVTFIVVTEEKPQLELFSVSDIAAQTASVQSHQSKQISALNDVQAKVKLSFGKEEGFKMGFTYTIATTGFSMTTAYGNKGAIEKMAGVKSVYVAPTFALPETLDAEPYTNNASTMIGADVLNSTGYTGKGMRIAILDTGILLDHPNFAALSEDKLVDPMTRESVEAVWKTLNAGQMTDRLNVSYHSSKIPFAFNYSAGDFNVDNTYAHSDHGTHVAGISAANKVDGSSVIGVAPDAQLVVMQVFESTGGANWATIMAALEDCVRLEVDAANLSLGAAAGYTDPADDMLEVLNLFKESDIQVLIASGNDTSNAYMNAWGLDMSLISNPDIGLAGTPSTYTAALGVASVDNDGYEQLYFTVDGVDYGFQDSAAAAETIFINNFRDQTLEYVVVPGVGQEADYEGLDVTGKIALISRGTTSFPEKQATAQAHGAVGCVIYNNAIGLFLMQINDGEGNIPAVSIGQAAGQAMIAAAGDDGVGTMTVCNADMKLFNVDRTVSSFSSWGVTPDLKLKPEIAGVGGSIYATVDPDISGSYYGYMSGTSMATPQITGAMAVLIQYLDENYPEITGSEQRRLAANLLMSTTDPVMYSAELEYSPRAQGAGLANLVSATSTPAYLSNIAATEGRPKAEFGDDPGKTGVYEFSFQINNLSDEVLTYTFDSSVMTESIYADYFIANAPYGLEAAVETPEQVTVPANGSVTVNAKLTLTDSDKAYLDQFPNGIYVEGYLYAVPVSEDAEGVVPVTLTMPMVGFYGDWSDAPIFDDPVDYSLYPTIVYTYNSQLGTNPYFRNGASGEEYNSFSYSNPLAEVDFGMLRNAKRMDITVTNAVTGEVYHTLDGSYMSKSYYSASYGQVIPTYLMIEYGEIWDGMDANGSRLPDGTEITYKFEAWLDDGDDIADDSWSFNATLDTVSPEILNDNDLQAALRMDEASGRSYLTLEIQENQHIAALIFQSPSGAIMGKYELENVPGEALTGEYEITGFGNEFSIIVADYACNETEVEVTLNLGDQNNAEPQPAQLSKDRLYGNETFDGALLEGGWFSVGKEDFSDPRNETFDSTKRYYSAEYVNGYLVGQNAATGHLELITPTGSYWSTKVLCQNNGTVGQPNVWVLYDMALDHSGTLSASYEVSNEAMGTDGLFAVGWQYKGDNDNDGKDDGYNARVNIKFNTSGSVFVQDIARISGTDGAELLTLGITTEGDIYGIATNGILYTLAKATEYDASVGQYGENVIKCTPVGETSFVDYPGYGGANVIQSMGYDHNTGTMYWYAHSQVASG